jgi:hypothetical protein
MMGVCENCHNEPQKYYLPPFSKIFFAGLVVMHSLQNYFVRIRLIICNLHRRETPTGPARAACPVRKIQGMVHFERTCLPIRSLFFVGYLNLSTCQTDRVSNDLPFYFCCYF